MNKLLSITIGGVALMLSTGLQASSNVSTHSQNQQFIKDFRLNSYAVRATFGSGKKASQTYKRGYHKNQRQNIKPGVFESVDIIRARD